MVQRLRGLRQRLPSGSRRVRQGQGGGAARGDLRRRLLLRPRRCDARRHGRVPAGADRGPVMSQRPRIDLDGPARMEIAKLERYWRQRYQRLERRGGTHNEYGLARYQRAFGQRLAGDDLAIERYWRELCAAADARRIAERWQAGLERTRAMLVAEAAS